MQSQRGLTLLELLVVLAIIGFAIAGVSLSLRDSRQTQLEREAQRLVAILEAARARSRTSGVPLIWQATPEGFVLRSAQPQTVLATRTESWLSLGTQAVVGTTTTHNAPPANLLVLGPEPILAPARITLSVIAANPTSTQPVPSLTVATDGLRPFQVMP